MTEITPRTRLLGLIGSPVNHSLSPVMYNSAFQACGLDMCYVSFDVGPGDLEAAVKGMAALGFIGFNVTHPYKESVIPYLDSLEEDASLIGAVNTVVITKGRTRGYNTDGRGLVESLRAEGIRCSGKSVLILGAGGAAKAVAVALAGEKVERIVVANRNFDRAKHLRDIVSDMGVKSDAVSTDILNWENELQDIELIVNATPCGMYPLEDRKPLNLKDFEPAVVCDLVYEPRNTLLLQEAVRYGHTPVSGLGMLLYQGAEAFRLFTSQEPPIEAMGNALGVGLCQRL